MLKCLIKDTSVSIVTLIYKEKNWHVNHFKIKNYMQQIVAYKVKLFFSPHWIYPLCFMFLEIPKVVQWLSAVRQCWEEAVGGPPSPAQTGWTEQHEKEGAGSVHGRITEEPCQSKLSQGLFCLVKPFNAGFSFEFSKIAFFFWQRSVIWKNY